MVLRRFATLVGAALASTAGAQSSVSIDLTGVSISSTPTNPPDVVRNSGTATISAAPGYLYTFNPTVRGTGLLGAITIPTPKPLGDVLNQFVPGQYRVVTGAMRNPPGTRPCQVFFNTVGGTFSGLTINLTLDLDVLADGVGQAAVRNISKPSGLGLSVTAGGGTIQTWTPPPPVYTEWQFEGNLQSVKENGLAPTSGPSKLRYLDDARFGPILGGPGNENNLPNPPTPQGVTAAQSAFGLASSFGIPLPGGEDDTVYRTSPPRNLADPTNRTKSRGLGLLMWPNTRDFWPDDKIAQWTFIWDLYIPASAWASEWPVPLIEDNHNNDQAADCLIRQSGGSGSIGYGVEPGQFVSSALLGPNRWMRVALVSDGYRLAQGRLFVNGTFIGTTSGDWVYNSTKSTDPRYGDVSTAQPVGTPVAPADWAAWGQFPSPWVFAPNASNTAPMASTVCLFSDLQGRGESVYVANMLFSDEAMTDAQIAALGGTSARGIMFPRPPARCVADYNADGGIDGGDVEAFFIDWSNGSAAADVNEDGGVDGADVEAFFTAWESGSC
ncbi:MAG: hypothetical protein JSR77_12065 [Planctomycetes bacterium]|nr:hypothetical protein [Planctomycetota bacterium]